MRTLLFTYPARGHFTPLVPLGRALLAAGHTVGVATAEGFREIVEGAGLELVPAGIDGDEAFRRARAADPEFRNRSAEEQGRRVVPDVFVGQSATAMLEDAGGLLAWEPDVVIREEGEFAGPLIAAMAGVPWVDHGWGPLRPKPLVDAAAEALKPLWAAYGQEPHATGGAYEWLYLDPCPPSLQFAYAQDVAVRHQIQPLSPAPAPGTAMPAWFNRLDGRQAVYITLGTVPTFANDPSFFAAVIDGLRDEEVEVIVTVGPSGDPDGLGPQPPHIHIERFVPQAALLPHCAAAVTNGGSGATIGALAAGVPVLVVANPAAPSQVRNAQAAAEHGAGRVLTRADATPEQLKTEIRTLLDDPSYTAAARQIAAEVSEMPTPDALVPVIEHLAKTRQRFDRPE